MPALRRKRLHLWLGIILVSAILGTVYGLFLTLPLGVSEIHGGWLAAAIGAVQAAVIGACVGALEVFGWPPQLAQRVRELPFLVLIALKALAYGAIVMAVHLAAPGPRLFAAVLGRRFDIAAMTSPAGPAVGYALGALLIVLLAMQTAQLVGFRALRDLFLGRYRRPRAELRFFLFVDVVGSTAIAERLGPLKAHRFLAAVFTALAEPIAACGGEIHQYVGDELVVTWTQAEAVEAGPLHCFFLMEAALAGRAAEFRREFSAAPRLRAALHFGEVITGEVGVWRRAIVFHGDVMNAASRLENSTREVGRRFIASAQALQALGTPERIARAFACHDLGALVLRGRLERIHAFAIERPGAE